MRAEAATFVPLIRLSEALATRMHGGEAESFSLFAQVDSHLSRNEIRRALGGMTATRSHSRRP